jgi:hypothetical protein
MPGDQLRIDVALGDGRRRALYDIRRYLLHAYFGRDGREEAEALLERDSGDADKPRILGTFNEPITDWLSFFRFTYFTGRDGKYQLKSLAESAFDPLARTTQFMLTERGWPAGSPRPSVASTASPSTTSTCA